MTSDADGLDVSCRAEGHQEHAPAVGPLVRDAGLVGVLPLRAKLRITRALRISALGVNRVISQSSAGPHRIRWQTSIRSARLGYLPSGNNLKVGRVRHGWPAKAAHFRRLRRSSLDSQLFALALPATQDFALLPFDYDWRSTDRRQIPTSA